MKKKLNNGVNIDVLGFGTYKMDSDITKSCVLKALEVGYRRIDTASYYANEYEIGQAIKESGLKRNELFVTTKVWLSDYGYEKTISAFEKSLKLLNLEYLDMYLLHWPYPNALESYRALEHLYREGKIKSIGVCNFTHRYLEELIDNVEILPTINQIEFHPKLNQQKLQEYCQKHNIIVEAWSPLIRGKVTKMPEIVQIAEKYSKSAAQVTIKWHIQENRLVIPKSATPSRIEENFDVFDFELTQEELEVINSLNMFERQSIDPDVMYNTKY